MGKMLPIACVAIVWVAAALSQTAPQEPEWIPVKPGAADKTWRAGEGLASNLTFGENPGEIKVTIANISLKDCKYGLVIALFDENRRLVGVGFDTHLAPIPSGKSTEDTVITILAGSEAKPRFAQVSFYED